MIEVLWKSIGKSYYDIMYEVSLFFEWLCRSLREKHQEKDEKKQKDLFIHGYTLVWDTAADTPAILIFTNSADKENQKEVLNILMQPPGEYKEKYVACILSQEPEGVREIKEVKYDSDSSDVEMELVEESEESEEEEEEKDKKS